MCNRGLLDGRGALLSALLRYEAFFQLIYDTKLQVYIIGPLKTSVRAERGPPTIRQPSNAMPYAMRSCDVTCVWPGVPAGASSLLPTEPSVTNLCMSCVIASDVKMGEFVISPFTDCGTEGF